MKFVMNSHDIMAILSEIKNLGECRLNNIYDVDGKFISIKIKTKEKQNKFIMIDAGKKIYISDEKIDNDRKLPTSFIMKLRKHLENKIILGINQINYDRVVDISFGYTNTQYHLIIEFYASGNIIFTDENYKILALFNTHVYQEKKEETEIINENDSKKKDKEEDKEQDKEKEKDKDSNNKNNKKDNKKKNNKKEENNDDKVFVKVNEIYPLHKSVVDMSVYDISELQFKEWYDKFSDDNKQSFSVKKLLLASPLIFFGKENIEHSLLNLSVDTKKPLNFEKLNDIIFDIKKNHIITDVCKGYIIMENDKPETFCPIWYKQYENKKVLVNPSFSKAVEEYYKLTSEKNTKITQKDNGKKTKESDKDLQKINNIRNQVKKMEDKYNDTLKKIQIIEENIDLFNSAIKLANESVDMSLEEHRNNINQSLKEHNIKVDIIFENTNRVNIKNKKIKIIYQKNTYIIDPKHHAYDHISNMYKDNKILLEKMENIKKMLVENEMLYQKKQIKNNQKEQNVNIDKDIKKEENEQNEQIEKNEETKSNTQVKRKILWFEQFHWFISSEGLIVVVGKSADQNEMLVKRYMENHDLYMHSDVHGSGSCIIKRNPNDKEIPHITLEEASAFLICHTKAWNQNSPDRTYWVYPNQVSKTPKTGEYVVKGSFIITGEKNYMTIPRLELGLTIMFKDKNNDVLSNKISDDTQFAIPMCAPYRLVNKNKFKIKIVPGNKSINKTIKNSVLSVFNKQTTSNKEQVFIKEITNDDYQKVLVPNMKILG
jgi:predicted ribosome quality control (RQC) complex YloA/Tae2 family protein